MRWRASALVLVMASATPAALEAQCSSGGVPGASVDWDALYSELALSPPDRLDFQVGGQVVVLHASTVPREYDDMLHEVIENIGHELEALGVELGAREARPVHVVATVQDDILPGVTAFTWCGDDTAPLAYYADGSVVPGTVCLIVVFPERIDAGGSERLAFVMAHEWMHTFQFGAHPSVGGHTLWWAEGSADWFAHRVVDGFEERARAIHTFYDMQPRCTLQQITYPSQVFFFWGERAFDARWVMDLALDDGEHVSTLAGIAGIMGPEHWRAWSIALADDTIRYPDGRPLPKPPEPDTLRLRPKCPLRIQGPPLSVQMRRVELAGGAGGERIHFDTGGAIVSLRWPDGRWQHLKEVQESVDPGAWDHFTIAAISASEQPANIRIGAGGLGDDCACHIGDWMELPAEGGRSFRREPEPNPGLAMAGYSVDVRYANDGPVLTLNPDQTYSLDDPYVERYMAQGEVFWELQLDTHRDMGHWRLDEERGLLVLTREAIVEEGRLDAAGVVSPVSKTRTPRGHAIPHEFQCVGDRLEMSAVGRAQALRIGSDKPPPAAVFRRTAAGSAHGR